MPDTEGAKSSGIRPAVPGSQIERSRIAAVPDAEDEILPRTPRPGKIRRRTTPVQTPDRKPANPPPPKVTAAEPAESEIVAKAVVDKTAAEKAAAEQAAAEKAKIASEAQETAARFSAVRNELATALNQASALRRSQRRDRITAIAVATVLTALVAFPRLPAFGARPQAALPARPQQTSPASEVRATGVRLVPERGPMTLARSLDRLNYVIAAAGRRPQDVLFAVRVSRGADRCPFVWTDGQVSLIYRGSMTMSSVTDTLARCAEAVELLATDRMQ